MTISRVDHTAIAVRDLDEAIPRFQRIYGVHCRERVVVPEQSVEVAFLPIGDTQLELICPLSEESGVARFLNTRGESLHHVAVQVDDINEELARLADAGTQLIDRVPRSGPHGRVAFVHPRGTGGVLLELVENT